MGFSSGLKKGADSQRQDDRSDRSPVGRVARRRLLRWFAAGAALLKSPGLVEAQAAAPVFDVHFQSNVRVVVRDGVALATDVYRPAQGGEALERPFPVLMERTPYGRNVTSFRDITSQDPRPKTRAEIAEIYVRRGYVVVFQDCRGCYDSEGQFIKYVNEAADGLDTCGWIVSQPWCNGRLGTFGLSYAAHTQVALGCLNPPGLRAMFIDCGGFSNAYQGGIRQGGAFELKQVTWAYSLGLESKAAQRDPGLLAALRRVDLKAWFLSMPWKRGHTPISLLPDYEAYVYDQWEHGVFDAFWKQVGLYAEGSYPVFARAAMVHLSGWYDPYSRTATDNYVGLAQRRASPVRLIMGPWTHGARSVSYSGDADFGPASTLDADGGQTLFDLRLRWFDRHLKDAPAAASPTAIFGPSPVRLFIMGGGTGRRTLEGRLDHGGAWRSEPAWPIQDRRDTRYYCRADGSLALGRPAQEAESISFVFDPHHPVPTIGGAVTSGEPLMRGGGYDQREAAQIFASRQPYLPLAARPDVLVFETPPLVEDVEVTGVIEANLWVSSNCLDTDFTIKLIDVYPASEDYPDGYSLNLTDGILRCRYRVSFESPTLMTPGEIYQIKVRAFPTSNLFKKRHRIRLDVSSSNFPRFDVNPNTGAPEGRGLVQQTAINTVFVDKAHPSHVVLPIVPARGLRTDS